MLEKRMRYGREFREGAVRIVDITHRHDAIIETTFADLIDGLLAHIPSFIWS